MLFILLFLVGFTFPAQENAGFNFNHINRFMAGWAGVALSPFGAVFRLGRVKHAHSVS